MGTCKTNKSCKGGEIAFFVWGLPEECIECEQITDRCRHSGDIDCDYFHALRSAFHNTYINITSAGGFYEH